MKKLAVYLLLLCMLGGTIYQHQPVHAATHNITAGSNGPNCSDGGYFTPNTLTIDAGETITFSVPANDPYPAGLTIHNFPGGDFTILPGQSHTTPALLVDIPSFNATWPSSGCQKGTGSITVKASTTPPPAPAIHTTSPPPAPSTTPMPAPVPAAVVNPPAALKVDKITIGDEKADASKPISIDESQSITLSGITIADGAINLTIHSTPRTETTRANPNGLWSFTIENLDPGSHTIEATVTDLATKKTSDSVTLLKFTVTKDPNFASTAVGNSSKIQKTKKKSNLLVFIMLVIVLLAAAAGSIFYWLKKKSKLPSKPKAPQEQMLPPAPPTTITPTV